MSVGPGVSIGQIETTIAAFEEPLPLESGHVLPRFEIAYETYGKLSMGRDNVIIACHALSGDAHAAGVSARAFASAVDGAGAGQRAQAGLGWWDGMIGPGKAFDTDRYFLLCANVLGSCRGSTGPRSIDPTTGQRYNTTFPVVTVADMVRAQRRLIDRLGIRGILATSGGSLGGMQALEWAVRYPDLVRGCIPIASTTRLAPMGLAWSAIGRNAIMADPRWRGGNYSDDDPPMAGLAIARMVGHVTYLSAASIAEKFGRRLQDREEYSYSFAVDFAVESYLRYQGDSFTRRFDANSYLYLSRALSYFDIARAWGQGSLAAAMARARARFLILSFSSDWLYPPSDSATLAEALRDAGVPHETHVIASDYGHDAFLIEEDRQTAYIRTFLRGLDA
ncbi:MAG: homoserine O-acetyltransferase [Chloroflexi bacterium]|nr:homoserine O-acetyltransferase [Chloroflexota bacterium]